MSGTVFSAASRLAGLMFLPPAVMMSSFLRSTIAQVAVVVELADVAGVERAVGVERLGRLLRVVEVAEEHVAAAAAHLAVVGEEHVDAGEGHADGARPSPCTAPTSSGRVLSDMP